MRVFCFQMPLYAFVLSMLLWRAREQEHYILPPALSRATILFDSADVVGARHTLMPPARLFRHDMDDVALSRRRKACVVFASAIHVVTSFQVDMRARLKARDVATPKSARPTRVIDGRRYARQREYARAKCVLFADFHD